MSPRNPAAWGCQRLAFPGNPRRTADVRAKSWAGLRTREIGIMVPDRMRRMAAARVVGDFMADWLAYGLEQAYAESTEIGVVRKVRSSAGLIDHCKDEFRKWLEQNLGNEKPAFIAVMIGMNDRRSIQPCAASGNAGGAKPGPYAFRAKEWTEAYAKEIDEAISALKGKGVPVFWVGLPPARNIPASALG